MSRKEFTTRTKRAAFERCCADGKPRCEGFALNVDGLLTRCFADLTSRGFHYDHDLADNLGGEPTLENCKVLCLVCHKAKTKLHDMPRITKGRRIRKRRMGIKKRSTFACSRQSKWKKKISGEVVAR